MRLPFIKPKSDAPTPSGDAETIRGKLTALEREIADASAELDRRALLAVLTDDTATAASAAEATTRLDGLRQRRELLRRALAAAELAQADKLASLAARDLATRRRALAQHAGRAQRDAADLTAALVTLRDTFRRLAATGQSITALLPPSMQTKAAPFNEIFGQNSLRGLANIEAFRLSQDGLPAPGATERPAMIGVYEDRQTGAVKPLAAILGDLLEQVRAVFELSATNATPPVQPSPALSDPATVGTTPQPAVVGTRQGEVVDLRGEDLGIEKHAASEASRLEKEVAHV